ncbi:MAG: pitrilysin family protein [Gammaproteobacteria bacterium]|jgi:zinc protease
MLTRLLQAAVLLFLSAGAIASEVHEFMLDNGMKVLVKEDHRAPIAVSQVWYRVGASYEPRGLTGVSHVLEHMMFKGTEKHGPNEFSQIIAANGGKENAFTGRDYTAYFQTLASDRLRVAFELEADRMENLNLDDAEFQKERQVVIEERRMRTDDKPTSLTYEQFNATAYRVLPYRNPVIGWRSDLENLTLEDLSHWYSAFYAPNNAALVVVGDVDPQEIHRMAQETFGKVRKREVMPVKPAIEPEQRGLTRIQVRAPAKQPYLIMGYKTPTISSAEVEWEPYALEIAAAVLDGGDSARISTTLIRGNRVAASAGAWYDSTMRLSNMMVFDGVPNEGKNVKDLEKAMLSEIERLKNEPVDASELKRIITQVVASKVYEKDSVYYQAMQIGMLETVGLDWRLADTFVDKLKAVTPEQVQAVAKKYFVPDNLTVAVLEPQSMQTTGQQAVAGKGGDNDVR